MQLELGLETLTSSKSSSADSLVKRLALLGNVKDFKTIEVHSFLKSHGFSQTKDPDIFYSKMYQTYLVTTMEKLSAKYLGFAPKSGTMFNGMCLIQKTSVSRNNENECFLSEVLEKAVDPKFFLSQELISSLMNHNNKDFHGRMSPKKSNEKVIATTLLSRMHKMGRTDNYVEEE